MTVGILLITHNQVGRVLLETALVNLHLKNPGIIPVDVPFDSDPDLILKHCRHAINEFRDADGIVILTDLFGSTPSNIAHKLTEFDNAPVEAREDKNIKIRVISGLNLPMLMRIITYLDKPLDTVTDKALQGGREGILISG